MALMLHNYLDIDKLGDYVQQGLVDAKEHPEFPLTLYCYGRKAVYDNVWDDVTTRCRGLIVSRQTGEIIARPFEKFFNVGTAGMPATQIDNLPIDLPVVTEKLDGSLGILYRYNDADYIASKGSFTSEHAKWAMGWYRAYVGYRGQWPKGYTPVFEMICEQVQRHVVSYGGRKDGLVLTALISIDSGLELPHDIMCNWAETNRVPYAKRFDKTVSEVMRENNPNEEGYVLSWARPGLAPWSAPFRVKVKFIDFLRLQRVLHSVGPKEILDALRHSHLRVYFGDWLNSDTMPKEFIQYVKGWMLILGNEYSSIKKVAHDVFCNTRITLGPDAPRKLYALAFTSSNPAPYPAILFAMLDNNHELVDSLIWEACKPLAKEAKPLWENEDVEK